MLVRRCPAKDLVSICYSLNGHDIGELFTFKSQQSLTAAVSIKAKDAPCQSLTPPGLSVSVAEEIASDWRKAREAELFMNFGQHPFEFPPKELLQSQAAEYPELYPFQQPVHPPDDKEPACTTMSCEPSPTLEKSSKSAMLSVMDAGGDDPFVHLPEDVILQIVSQLEPEHLASARMVSDGWRARSSGYVSALTGKVRDVISRTVLWHGRRACRCAW